MQKARQYSLPLTLSALVLFAAAVAILGGDVFLPGHHIHVGSDVGHHHHFFFGDHDHGEDDGRAMERVESGHRHDHHDPHGHDVAADCDVAATVAETDTGPAPSVPADHEPDPDRHSGTALIDDFPLDTPTSEFRLAAPRTRVLASVVDSGSSIPATAPFLPGGARAPPATSLV